MGHFVSTMLLIAASGIVAFVSMFVFDAFIPFPSSLCFVLAVWMGVGMLLHSKGPKWMGGRA